jgi:glycosyltransferase involved in cell wall biosynthesis
MSSNLPLISVIIPVYNGDRYLAEAIESVLAQNYHPIEIIVIDDGSTDNTRQVAESLKKYIHYIYQPNRGAAAARNTGLKIAAGDLIAFLDADDIWNVTKLKIQTNIFTENPVVEIVSGYLQTIYLKENTNEPPEFEHHGAPTMSAQLGASLFRKSVFERVGLFDEELQQAEDLDWFMRAEELRVSIEVHVETVIFYRRHDRNITNQISSSNQYFVRVLKKSLDRRRKKNNGRSMSITMQIN